MSQTLTVSKTGHMSFDGKDIIDKGYGDYGSDGDATRHIETAKLGLRVTLGSVTMLFAAFTSAYIVRSAGSDWVPLELPSVLWLSTFSIVLSSVTMDLARRAFRHWRPVAFRKWLFATSILGTLFLAGQLFAWNQLASQGIYVSSHPHSSFFYVLSGVHAVHLLVGLLALFYVLVLATRYRLTPAKSAAPVVVATYWNFVGAIWIYLLVVLFYM